MRFFRTVLELIRETLAGYGRDNGSLLAASLAYYTIFAIAPLLIIVVSVAGLVFGEAAVSKQIQPAIQDTVGEAAATLIQSLVANVSESGSGTTATILGAALLLFTASNLFHQLQRALNVIWGVAPTPNRGIVDVIKKRLLTFLMVLVVGVLLILSIIVDTINSAFDRFVIDLLPQTQSLIYRLDDVVSLSILILLFAILFKLLPDVHISWKDVLLGAVVTAVLSTLGKYAIERYISQGAASSTIGAAGSIIILLVWIFYSSQILLLGAEFTEVYANKYGSMLRPTKNNRFIKQPVYQPPLESEVEPLPIVELPEPEPVPILRKQIASGLIGIAVGLLMAFLNSMRRK